MKPEDIKRLAQAASPSPHHVYIHARDDNNWDANLRFHQEVGPTEVLKLLSPWQPIPAGGPSFGGMILVRKRNDRGGWNVRTAYRTVSDRWACDVPGWSGIEGFEEWMRIPE